MLLTPIDADGQTRNWYAHADPLPGVYVSRYPTADHDDVQRFRAFTRPLCHDEVAGAPLRPLEHGVAIVQRTCDPRTVKRSYWAAWPNVAPWPPEPRDDHHRPLDRRMAARWRRL